MKLDDFDFDLPDDLIATRPAKPRSSARLLVAQGGSIRDAHVFDLPDVLRPGDRLVLNNTRVIPARLSGVRRRDTGQGLVEAGVEATLLSPDPDGNWSALLKPLRKVKPGEVLYFDAGLQAELLRVVDGQAVLRFNLDGIAFQEALNTAGAMPLPPYIAAKRAADDQDKDDYQTIFAQETGAVAAPTASLHFDDALLSALKTRGVDFSTVTLHVGAGTFLPVKVEDVTTHRMHSEWGSLSAQAAQEMIDTKASGGRVIPVGTTALRLIETATKEAGEIAPWEGDTEIFIYPGFKFGVTDALMTNFHLPKSTLMMLVSALMGQERMMAIYAHAIAERYRFFSYGDSSILFPDHT